jgi:hypothetical protein
MGKLVGSLRRSAPAALVILGLLLLALVLGKLTAPFDSSAPDSDPIGDASDRDWSTSNCSSSERFARFNDAGYVATLRESVCDWGLGVDTARYYVFVKRVGSQSSRDNLALRIELNNESTPPPVVEWVSQSRVLVSYAGAVSPITKRRARVGHIAIAFFPAQPYAGFVMGSRRIVFAPGGLFGPLPTMTFDLLSLPSSPPRDPIATTGDFSVFGCDQESREISAPVRYTLNRLLRYLERRRRDTGRYPRSVYPTAVRGVAYLSDNRNAKLGASALAPTVRVMYHRFGDTYALELRFPDLQAGYKPPTGHYDSYPAEEFISCTAIHSGLSAAEVRDAGGFVLPSEVEEPPILFTPRFGVYTYVP